MRERALDYPYDAPHDAYLLKDGYQRVLSPDYDFGNRTAVLSVGSNRAPAQLFRKFGVHAEVPVTPVTVDGCDIVHVANLAPYGAVPCTAFPCAGTLVRLNIAWLDSVQLEIMHETESLGVAYEWVEWDRACLSGDGFRLPDRVFGYAALSGGLASGDEGPFALTRIPQTGRRFAPRTQQQMQQFIHSRFCDGPDTLDQWIERLQTDAELREKVRLGLAAQSIHPSNPPWRAVSVQEIF